MTAAAGGSTLCLMDDDDAPRRRDDPIDRIGREDLTPLSVDELHERITLLKAEIARVEGHLAAGAAHRAAADALFRSGG